MTRRSKDIKIEPESSRDFGKMFRVTEWDAFRAEWWAFRAMQAIAGTEVDVTQLLQQAQAAEMVRHGLHALAKVPPAVAQPLLEEMIDGVAVVLPDGNARAMRREDVEEVTTLFRIRAEVFEVNLGFFALGAQ